MTIFNSTERVGISAVDNLISRELGWIFREQPIVDMGIDAHIERVDDGVPTGRLIGVQVKSGESHFRIKEDSLTYYGKPRHLEYWTEHSLPVILVAHLPDTNETFWAIVSKDTTVRTKKGWKIEIPKSQRLGRESMEALSPVFEGPPSTQRYRKLAVDEPLMRHIQAGGKVSLDLDDWINKSLGRTPVVVYVHDGDGNEHVAKEWFQYYVGFGIKELAEALFPWATASVDDEFYGEHGVLASASDYDEFAERNWSAHDEVYPYDEAAGEVEMYRLRLELNDLGQAYLLLADYLHGDDTDSP